MEAKAVAAQAVKAVRPAVARARAKDKVNHPVKLAAVAKSPVMATARVKQAAVVRPLVTALLAVARVKAKAA